MAPKRSIASLVRKKLSDITNSHPHPKLHTQPQKPHQTSPSHDILIQQLLKVQSFVTLLIVELVFSHFFFKKILLFHPQFLMQEKDALMQLLAEREYPSIN